MSLNPIQSDSSSSVRRTEKQSASASYHAKDGAAVSSAAQAKQADAVRVSIKSDRREQAPPPPPPPSYSARSQRAEKNFKDIDSDSDGSLTKAELTSAQERRQADGKKTPLIDRALASYDQNAGKDGISFQQFYKKDNTPPPPPPSAPAEKSEVKES